MKKGHHFLPPFFFKNHKTVLPETTKRLKLSEIKQKKNAGVKPQLILHLPGSPDWQTKQLLFTSYLKKTRF